MLIHCYITTFNIIIDVYRYSITANVSRYGYIVASLIYEHAIMNQPEIHFHESHQS